MSEPIKNPDLDSILSTLIDEIRKRHESLDSHIESESWAMEQIHHDRATLLAILSEALAELPVIVDLSGIPVDGQIDIEFPTR